ncbi:hypothetical protein CSX04_02936 [Burkholderia cepacia]|nr:hypothetical protein CSX04_02936 [Burkholderia cepacia]
MTNLAPLTWQDCVQPDWQVSPRVRALITTRAGGVSEGPYGRWQGAEALPGGMNLGLHTGDDPAHVAANRARCSRWLASRAPRGSSRFTARRSCARTR